MSYTKKHFIMYAVYETATSHAKRFRNFYGDRITEPMTFEQAKAACSALNVSGYIDDMVDGYDVRPV